MKVVGCDTELQRAHHDGAEGAWHESGPAKEEVEWRMDTNLHRRRRVLWKDVRHGQRSCGVEKTKDRDGRGRVREVGHGKVLGQWVEAHYVKRRVEVAKHALVHEALKENTGIGLYPLLHDWKEYG